jgi:signal transduction histidine kinase
MEAATPSPTALIGFAIAHEVRNLLTPACAYLEMAKLDGEHFPDSIQRAQSAIERALAFADTVLAAKPSASCDIAAAALSGLQDLDLPSDCQLVIDIPNSAKAAIAQPVLERVLANLVANSIEAIGRPGGEIRVECFPWNGGWRLQVCDNGPGMVARRETRPSRGRGLQICLFLVEQVGGALDLESEPGAGCRVVIDLPSAQSSESRQAA